MPHVAHRGEISRSGASARVDDLEAHLVVALAGAAVGDGVGAVLAGRGDQVLDDHRPRQRRHQRVPALVEGVGPERRAAEVAGELLAAVDDDGLDGAGGRAPGPARPSQSPPWPTSAATVMTSTP